MNKIIATHLPFIIPFDTPLSDGINSLCVVFSMALSNVSIIAGSTVTHATTPITTPFDITIPILVPSLNVIKQSAKNPAIVVTELLDTDINVLLIACAIALLLSPGYLSLLAS